MKKNKIIIMIAVLVLVIVILVIKNKPTQNETVDELSSTVSNNQEIEGLKQEYKMTGENEIYNIETEYDGRKVLKIKPNVNFKAAFAGMFKGEMPNFEELDSIFEQNAPKEKGIWIKKEDREKILTYLNKNLSSEYEINSQGYLQIKEKNNANTYDQVIEKLISGDKQYIFCISSICYMVDTVTGKIIDNPYNQFEPYQTYEYFMDKERTIIFMTENRDSKIEESEIFESIMELIEYIEEN